MSIKIKLIHKQAKLPSRATPYSTGYDLCSVEDALLLPSQIMAISTGLVLEIPIGYDVQIRPRSGLALKHGITVLNTPGTVDADYRGEVKVILINLNKTEYRVSVGDRIAQMVISRHDNVDIELVQDLSDTVRGVGGFGHTGK